MNVIAELQNLNYTAIVVATLASYGLGFAWYHWAVFGEAWAKALGLSKQQADSLDGVGGAYVSNGYFQCAKRCIIWRTDCHRL